ASPRSARCSATIPASSSRARPSGSASIATSSALSGWRHRRPVTSPSVIRMTRGAQKLEALRASVSSTSRGALLAYSDARIIDADDKVVADTYWSKRRNNHTNLASLLIANTITGAASLFRRELLDYALPFPEVLGTQYHDHWLGAVALSLGEVAYVDRPL